MLLTLLHVRRYRSAEDTGAFDVDPHVTCLVGKNESGKTAVLQGTYRLNPTEVTAFDEVTDYPSRLTRERKQQTGYIEAVRASYTLTDTEVGEIETDLGAGVLTSRDVVLHRGYRAEGFVVDQLDVDEEVAVQHLKAPLDLPSAGGAGVGTATTIDQLVAALVSLQEPPAAAAALLAQLQTWPAGGLREHIANTYLAAWQPRFVYFADYDTMPGKVSIPDLVRRRDTAAITRGEQALLSLLDMVGARPDDFTDVDNHEHLIRETENAANTISDEVFDYWSQNRDLAVELRVLEPEAGALPPLDVGPVLQVRVRNNRHRVSVPFDERSRGFVWFFSFLAYFSQLEREAGTDGRDLVLLLDEPGLSLHATAQRDLLRLIDERLAPKHQVIYSTHSPFLVSSQHLGRVRTVIDADGVGTKVSADVLRADTETAFPLQAALGYEMTQTLFVGPDNLLLEGPSDLVYLDVLDAAVAAAGRVGLDPRWVKVPVGGAGKLSTFVSLMGANKLNVAVVMDSSTKDAAAVDRLRDTGRLAAGNIITIGEVIGRGNADVEDLLDPEFYLKLVNRAYACELSEPIRSEDLISKDLRIVRRVEERFQAQGLGRLNHYRPAAVLLRQQNDLVDQLDPTTLERAEALFARLNQLIPG